MIVKKGEFINQHDQKYRSLSKEQGDYVVDLEDLFTAIKNDKTANQLFTEILSSTPPLLF